VASGCLCVAGFSGAIAKASKDPPLGRESTGISQGFLGDFIGKLWNIMEHDRNTIGKKMIGT